MLNFLLQIKPITWLIFLFESFVTVTLPASLHTHWKLNAGDHKEEEEAVAVWVEMSAKSSVIKFDFLNHEEFICKTASSSLLILQCNADKDDSDHDSPSRDLANINYILASYALYCLVLVMTCLGLGGS